MAPTTAAQLSISQATHLSPEEEDNLPTLSKFTLFETHTRFYITATSGDSHRVLKIDRSDPIELNLTEDATVYNTEQLDMLLRMVQDGNKGNGGLEKVCEFHGIIGFVKFKGGWYMIVVMKRSVVGLLGGHYVYHCDDTLMIALSRTVDRGAEELRMNNLFRQVDLSKNFYFSYSYDLTNTMQTNLIIQPSQRRWNTRFMWNHHLLSPAFDLTLPRGQSRWVLPLIHGFVDQAKIGALARTVYVTIIARRSRHYAGARFLTRGVNEDGYVANEVETEQIVSEPLQTSFGNRTNLAKTGYDGYTSFVQHRGSVPVMWHQESSQITPRPPIHITIRDPFYVPAAKHFNDLLSRYGAPICILNLVKQRESTPRESKLLYEYKECVEYLNQFLPDGKKMQYHAWDMAAAQKSRHQDIMGVLEDIAEESLQATKFFHGGPARNSVGTPYHRDKAMIQQGILRTNCVDCLDRTNAAQFAIAKRAFGHQLYALGFLETPNIPFESDAVQVLTEMYHDHGDTLAWQYTGSALVNRVDTYRRPHSTQWNSHSRDLLENIRRFYSNSMLDADKQAAMNLFLGIEPQPHTYKPKDRDYRYWFNPSYLDPPEVSDLAPMNDSFKEYYKPHILSSFSRLYAFTMNSSVKFQARNRDGHYVSPFEARREMGNSHASPSPTINGAFIPDPSDRITIVRHADRARARMTLPTPGTALPAPSATDEAATSAAIRPDEAPTRQLIADLYDPPDLAQRIAEYDWWLTVDPADYRPMARDMALYAWGCQVDDTVSTVPPNLTGHTVGSGEKWKEWEALEKDEGDGGEWWRKIGREDLGVYERAVNLEGLFEK